MQKYCVGLVFELKYLSYFAHTKAMIADWEEVEKDVEIEDRQGAGQKI